MAEPATPKLLVLDACVLIDYAQADASVLGSVIEHVAPMAVVRPVFDEVEDLTEAEATELGLQIIDVEYELAAEAAKSAGTLSFEDRLCVLLAKRERWICVTNDKALRRVCETEGVELRWGLEMMIEAVRADAMSIVEAERIAWTIHELNPRYVTRNLVDRFSRKLRSRARPRGTRR